MRRTTFALERTIPPADEPVTLADAIEQVREFSSIPNSAKDQLNRLITAAREWVEDYTGRALYDQTWRLTVGNAGLTGNGLSYYRPGYYCGAYDWYNRFNEIRLRRSPALSVGSFVSVDDAGAETTIESDTYELREASGRWPRLVGLNGTTWCDGTYRVTFRAGFTDTAGSPEAGLIPACFKQAILLHVEAHYDRDPVMMQKLLDAAKNLLRHERVEMGAA